MKIPFIKLQILLIGAICMLSMVGCAQERLVGSNELLTQTNYGNASEGVLTASKFDGVFLVNHEIAMGRWESDEDAGNACYWVRRKYDAIVRGEFYGAAGGVMEIVEGDYEVEMRGCGEWDYLGP